jgi:hypothetical protein
MTWHAEPSTLTRYATGSLDDARASSIELHLLACEKCRVQLGSVSDAARLERVWGGIEMAVGAPRPRRIERMLLTGGVPQHVARLLAATPSLRFSWLLSVAIALAFAVVAAHATGGIVLFLIVAPLLPLAGVAAAYGPGVDPTYEIGVASPLSSFRLLLIRAVSVLVSTLTLALVAALGLPDLGWMTAAWLIPSLGLVTLSLSLATVVPPLRAASIVAFSWVTTTILGATGNGTSIFGAPLQVAVVALAVLSVWLLSARRDAFEKGDRVWTR